MHIARGALMLGALVGCSLYSGLPGFAADRQLVIKPVKPAPAGEKRLALIIGNSAYKTSPLRNPVNDARSIAKALSATGFQVTVLEDGTQAAMRRAMRVFGDELQAGGVGLFYFAGHGMQVKGKNYLIPVNADIEREDEVEDQAVDANVILAKMDSAKNSLNLMVLDACRNNPFARSFRSSSSGLAQMDAPSGTLVAFATAPGSVAADGDGDNGLYTKHLLANINKPGLAIEQLFKEVRIGVTKETKDRQVPWESSSLKGNFFFVPGEATLSAQDQRLAIEKQVSERVALERAEQQKQMEKLIQEMLAKQKAEAAAAAVAAGAAREDEARKAAQAAQAAAAAAAKPAAPAITDRQMEVTFWESIKASTNPRDFQAYLDQYPQGTFVALARIRAQAHQAPAVAAAPAPAAAAVPVAVVQAPKPIPAPVVALKPAEAPRPVEPPAKPAAVQVASAAPTSMIGLGLDDPRYPKIGDQWEYSYTDTTTRIKSTQRVEVTAVSKDGILESIGTGAGRQLRAHSPEAVFSSNHLWVDFSPYFLSFHDVKPGQSWRGLRPTGIRSCLRASSNCGLDGKAVGVEKVKTAAGEFEALKFVFDFNGRVGVGQAQPPVWRQHTLWYSKEVKRLVKESVRTVSGSSMEADYEVELLSYRPAQQRAPDSGTQVASLAPTRVASTIDDPRYPKVGDFWEYSYLDTFTKQRRTARVEVMDVSKEGIVESGSFGSGSVTEREYTFEPQLVFNRLWLEFSPYLLASGEPKAGEGWKPGKVSYPPCLLGGAGCAFVGKAAGREKVSTPAGTFEALRVEFELNGRTSAGFSGQGNVWRQGTYWYSEKAKRVIKVSMRTRAGSTTEPDYEVELTSFKLN